MNKLISLLIFCLIIFSCVEEVATVFRTKQEQLELDKSRILGYLEENNLTGFISFENGLHYKVIEEGNSTYPVFGDTISVDYIGQLLNGVEFDRNNTGQPFNFILGNGDVIEGWELGIPLNDEGGTLILILPSQLGYGTSTSGSIPENSVLIFRIKILGIN